MECGDHVVEVSQYYCGSDHLGFGERNVVCVTGSGQLGPRLGIDSPAVQVPQVVHELDSEAPKSRVSHDIARPALCQLGFLLLSEPVGMSGVLLTFELFALDPSQ